MFKIMMKKNGGILDMDGNVFKLKIKNEDDKMVLLSFGKANYSHELVKLFE